MSKPKKTLKMLCHEINIPFSNKMLSWPKGKRKSDGLWEKIWYENVKSSTNFKKLVKEKSKIPSKYISIYDECLKIYNQINFYSLSNGD